MVTLIWSIYNLYLVTVSLGALWEKRQARKHHRLIVSGHAMVQFPRVRQRLAVDLLDLSLAGLCFTAKLDFNVKERERIIVEAASADGLVSYFEAEVIRRATKGDLTMCGAQLLVPAQSMPDVVHYVYGDSGRWLAVWDARARGVSLVRALWLLFGMGLRGAWICLSIIVRIARHWIRGKIKSYPQQVEVKQ